MNSGLIDFQVSAADVSLHGTLCTKVQDSTFPLGTICLHFWSHGSTNMSNMGGSYQYLSKHGSRSTKESSGTLITAYRLVYVCNTGNSCINISIYILAVKGFQT